MSSRWEKQALERLVEKLDPFAVGGRDICQAGLEPRIFNAKPEAHSEPTASACRATYEALQQAAQADGRLAAGAPLVKKWTLTADIYSPRLGRFIEIDEAQHFSAVRLSRLVANRGAPWGPLYAAGFWDEIIPRLLAKPRRDLDPPHRDEARAYRDEMRERLPVVYGLRRTIRLDEFTLKLTGLERFDGLILQIVERGEDDGNCNHDPGQTAGPFRGPPAAAHQLPMAD
jgi:hypothetical protein